MKAVSQYETFSKDNPLWKWWEIKAATLYGATLAQASCKGYDATGQNGQRFEMKSGRGATIDCRMSMLKGRKGKNLTVEQRQALYDHMEAVQATFLVARLYKNKVYYKEVSYQEAKATGFKVKITVTEIREFEKTLSISTITVYRF